MPKATDSSLLSWPEDSKLRIGTDNAPTNFCYYKEYIDGSNFKRVSVTKEDGKLIARTECSGEPHSESEQVDDLILALTYYRFHGMNQ